MANSAGMAEVLGMPQEINSFLDGKPRMAYPVKMRKFPEFVRNFAQISDKLWANYLIDEEGSAVHKLLEMTFIDEDIDDVLEQSTAKTFGELIGIIKAINGIDFNLEDAAKNVMEV